MLKRAVFLLNIESALCFAAAMHTPLFTPPWTLRNGHVQTLTAALHAGGWGSGRQTLRWEIDAHNALISYGMFQSETPAKTIVLLHGVGGSTQSAYLVRAARYFYAMGYHVIGINLRGSGDSAGQCRDLYHAGLTDDLRHVLDLLNNDPRIGSIAVVGFSLGGHMTLAYLSQIKTNVPPKLVAAATVSAPFDLAPTCTGIDRASRLVYRQHVLRGLKRNADVLLRKYPTRLALKRRALAQLQRVWDYDDAVIAPMHGFNSAQHYYDSVSCGPALRYIALPTLSIHAEDDPMVDIATLRPFRDSAASCIEFDWQQRGGHVGFTHSVIASQNDNWALQRIATFLRNK